MAKIFFKSIRFKVLIWYTLILTLTLFAFGILLYGSFNKAIYNDFDDLLSSRADGIANSINAYWAAKQAEGLNAKDPARAANFKMVASSWVEEKRKDPELMSIFTQILNSKGELLVASRSMPRIKQLSKEDFTDIVNGEDSFDTVDGVTAEGKKTRFRLYTKPVIENSKTEYVVQIAGPANLLSIALGNLRVLLFVLIPLTVILASLPGVLLVRLTLKPVDRMVDTLRQITAENLKLKIHIPDTKDEIKKLADTLNGMIDRLDRSFSSQQRFIQEISHDLKTPMNILKGELEAALKKPCSEQEYKTILHKSLTELDGFSKIIEDLLVIGQLDDNQLFFEIKKINLTRLIDQAMKDMKILSDQKEITASFSCKDNMIIDGDEAQLKRLLMELLDNAIKYTYRKGKVTVTASKDDKYVNIAVSDTGSGIPEDEINYIFDRFYQVDKSRNAKDGFGLGLSRAKSIVEAHKGSIKVESQDGKGSAFIVSLPLSYPG